MLPGFASVSVVPGIVVGVVPGIAVPGIIVGVVPGIAVPGIVVVGVSVATGVEVPGTVVGVALVAGVVVDFWLAGEAAGQKVTV